MLIGERADSRLESEWKWMKICIRFQSEPLLISASFGEVGLRILIKWTFRKEPLETNPNFDEPFSRDYIVEYSYLDSLSSPGLMNRLSANLYATIRPRETELLQ